MIVTNTDLEGVMIIEPNVFNDHRGYFFETFNAQRYQLPHSSEFVQDNEAKSDTGVLRGLHFQEGEFAQGKLVRVIKGSVYDVVVDIRPDSPTFTMWYGTVLSGDNKKQMWIPRGFAHGYLVLEDDTIFSYKCDNYYHKPAENGIRYDDPEIAISWPDAGIPFIISEKDLALSTLAELQL